ncbi:hypothetical protein HDU67_002203 [Dinochytrium kinnereticum]|nr:hypothetical protein HDU67_002203 [Dinochytrium kinnereticum]
MATLSHHHGGDDGSNELSLVGPDEAAAAAAAYGDHTGVPSDDSLLLPSVQPPPSVPAMMYHAASEAYSQAHHHYAAAAALAAHHAHLHQPPPPPPPNAYAYGAAPAAAAAAAAAAAGHLHSMAMPPPTVGGSGDSMSPSPPDGQEKVKKKRGPRQTSICHHGKRRSQCVQCYDEGTGGSTICKHRRQRYACRPCFDEGQPTNSLCIHRTIRIKCKECTPERPAPRAYRPRAKNSNGDSRSGSMSPVPQIPPPPAGYHVHMNGMIDPNLHHQHHHHLQALSVANLATPAPTPMTTPVVQPHTTGQLRIRKGWSRIGKAGMEEEELTGLACELCGSIERLVIGPSRQIYCFDCHIKSDPNVDMSKQGGNGNNNGGGSGRSRRSGGGSGSRSSSAHTPPDTPKRTRGSTSGNGGANGSVSGKRRRLDDGQPRPVDNEDDDTEDFDMDGLAGGGGASDQEPSPPTSSASGRTQRRTTTRKAGGSQTETSCSECNSTDLGQAFKDPSGEVVCGRCYKWLSKKGYRAQPVTRKSGSTNARRSTRNRGNATIESHSDEQTNTESADDDVDEHTDSAAENVGQVTVPFAGAPPFNLPAGMPVPPYYLVWYPSGSNPGAAGAVAGAAGAAAGAAGASATPYAWFPYYGGALYPGQGGAAGITASNPPGTDADSSSSIPAAAAALLSLQQDPTAPSNSGSPTEEGSSMIMPSVPFYMPGANGIPVPIPASMLAGAAGGAAGAGGPALIALTPEAAAAMTSQAAVAAAAAAVVAATSSNRSGSAPPNGEEVMSSSLGDDVIAAAAAAVAAATTAGTQPTLPATASGATLKPPNAGLDVPLTAPASPVQDVKALASVAAGAKGEKRGGVVKMEVLGEAKA